MTEIRRWKTLALVVLFATACDDAGGFTDEMPDDLPAGMCDETGTGADCETGGQASASSSSSSTTTTSEPASDCLVDGCVGQAVCAATWDAEAEVRGAFECRFACVPLLDDSAWCSDDASCCDAGARCTGRGYCILEGGSTSTGGGG